MAKRGRPRKVRPEAERIEREEPVAGSDRIEPVEPADPGGRVVGLDDGTAVVEIPAAEDWSWPAASESITTIEPVAEVAVTPAVVGDGRPRCGTCRHWVLRDEGPYAVGRCLRYPPTIYQTMSGGLTNAMAFTFPARSNDDMGCGEHAEVAV